MKRIICGIFAIALLLGLAACANTGKDWQEQYDLGMRYLEDGDYEEAILAFTAAIKIDGNRPEAYVGRADAYIATGETAKALKDYKKAKKIAEKSEKDYDDLIEDLEDTIDELEEEIDREESQNPETEPGGAESWTVAVTDAYSGQFEQYGSTFCCHIPQIHLENDLAAQVNAKIYDELSPYIESQTDEVTYAWGMEGEYLSVIVQTDFIDWAWTNYYVYTICITTGELVSQETLLDAFGLSREDYSAMAYTTLEQIVTQYDPDQIGGQKVYDYIVSHTLSDENIQETIPYIGENGQLCMVAARYSPAGASFYYGMYDLVTGEQIGSLPCNGNHAPSADVAADTHTVSEINALVVQWYNNNIGGYESGYFTADENDCFLVHDKCSVSVYFYDTDAPAPGTEALPFAVVQVDVNTGEMWDVMTGNSLAYLW